MPQNATETAAEIQIAQLAREIANQKSPHSALAAAASPQEIARALYLTGWQPPASRPITNALVNRLLFTYDNDPRFGVPEFRAALEVAMGVRP